MNKTLLIIIVLALILIGGGIFLFAGDSSGTPSGSNGSVSENDTDSGSRGGGDRLPEVEVQTADGEALMLTSFVGKPLVVNSWATWCPFCVDEIPDFVLLQEEFGDQIEIIAVNRRERPDEAGSFLGTIDVTAQDLTFLYDSRDNFYRKIGGFAMPETLFVNAEGEVVVHKRGFMRLDEMQENVQKILN